MTRTTRITYFTLLLAATTLAATAGRIVVVSDEWCLGNYFASSGSTAHTFATNAFAWLVQPTGNRTILVDVQFHKAHDIRPLLACLSNANYVVTLSDPLAWSGTTVTNYGAVLWERGEVSQPNVVVPQFVDYVERGGAFMILGGGVGVPMDQHNMLLNRYHLREAPILDYLRYTVTQYDQNHPVTHNVTHLFMAGPSPMRRLRGGAVRVLSSQSGIDWILVFAPEYRPRLLDIEPLSQSISLAATNMPSDTTNSVLEVDTLASGSWTRAFTFPPGTTHGNVSLSRANRGNSAFFRLECR